MPKQVLGKTSEPIWLKFISNVLFGMATDWLHWLITLSCHFCAGTMVILKLLAVYLRLVKFRFWGKLMDQLCWNSYTKCSLGWPLMLPIFWHGGNFQILHLLTNVMHWHSLWHHSNKIHSTRAHIYVVPSWCQVAIPQQWDDHRLITFRPLCCHFYFHGGN